uniref:Soldier-caste specific protein n=1 Tax=Coptotermes formosanus TaxID=36987 RepID=R4V1C5_COPFO|nr:soldier-caste specific protein [Coptotermes formosanus]
MLLIVLLGLIAKLALVSSDCDLGTVNVNDLDWTKFADSRPSYWLLHSHEEALDNFDCVESTFGDPGGDSSAVIVDAYDNRERRHIAYTSNATNWNNTGLLELRFTDPTWNGRYNILAIDYDRYFIVKYCPDNLNELIIGVAFRSSDPDKATLEKVKADLEDNGIDITQMVVWTRDHCQQA